MSPRSWRVPAALLLGWVACALLVDARADAPLIDDWIYAASVERLVAGNGLHVSAWSSTVPIVQIAWGALFVAAAGFSYTVLRVSTLVIAAAGLLAFFTLLRALEVDSRRAAIATATLALYPVWFVLSFTFMTDVPFVAITLASLSALAIGMRESPRARAESGAPGHRRQSPLVAVGLALSALAFLVRPVAIAIPAAVLVVAARRSFTRMAGGRATARGGSQLGMAAAAIATIAVMAAASAVVGRAWPAAGGEGGLAYRVERLRYVLLVSPVIYLEALCSMLAHLGLAALPVLVVTAPSPRRWPWRLYGAVLVVAAIASYFAPTAVAALRPRATWSVQELGAARPLLQAAPAPSGARTILGVASTLVGLLAAACLLARSANAWRRDGSGSRAWSLLGAYALISIAMCFVLWFFYDRYFLPIVPIAIAIAAATGSFEARRARTILAAAVLLAVAALDVTGTRDMLAYARAVDAAGAALRARGVAENHIDAGYVENGWRLYAHPEHLAAGQDPDRDVPNLTSAERLPFVVANGPLAGYVVERSTPVPTWWAQGDRVYVLRREDVAE